MITNNKLLQRFEGALALNAKQAARIAELEARIAELEKKLDDQQ